MLVLTVVVGCFAEPLLVTSPGTSGDSSSGTGAPSNDDGTSVSGASDADGPGSSHAETSTGNAIDGGSATCGDGILDDGEACDDANGVADDGCDPDCQASELVAIDGGRAHFCGLTRSGAVLCWGDNAAGQLGLGHTDAVGDDTDDRLDRAVELGARAIAVQTGGARSCAVLEDGSVRCWGAVGRDRLGDEPADFPLPAVALGGGEVRELAAGLANDCALLDGGVVRCWGQGYAGVLGQGNTDTVLPTDDAPAPIVPLGNAVPEHIACGVTTCCAASHDDVLCWGTGALGVGVDAMTAIGDQLGEMPPMPVQDTLITQTDAIAVGMSACRLAPDGEVRCWGANQAGQLGTGATAEVRGGFDDAPVSLPVASDTLEVVMGLAHLCARSTVGEVRCLGTGYQGANGAGTGSGVGDEPGETPPAPLPLAAPALLLGAANYATCAWLDTHELWCWGENSSGQLGQGDQIALGDDEPIDVGHPVPLFGRVP